MGALSRAKQFENLNYGPKGATYKVGVKEGVVAKEISTIIKKLKLLVQEQEERYFKGISEISKDPTHHWLKDNEL